MTKIDAATQATPAAALSAAQLLELARDGASGALAELNDLLDAFSAQERVAWAAEHLPTTLALSSSFGAQSAATLHLVTRVVPRVPVILVDTGYLFPETYRFADQLRDSLQLNLHVYRPELSPAWFEARHGKLWEQGVEGIERYNQLMKIEPMQRALAELGVRSWVSGLRRDQARSRSEVRALNLRDDRFEFRPIYDWTDRIIGQYLKAHALPYHPLWDQGFVSIGDWHTTRSLAEAGDDAEATRFFGLKRECGLHGLPG
jgi:phosphoadenosine phosphosulfate reductase